MKRPFAVVGITYLIAQTAAVLCGASASAVLFCIAVLCAIVLFAVLRKRPAWLLPAVLSCAVCFGLNAGYMFFDVEPTLVLEGQTVMVSGRICCAPSVSFGRYYYVIETDSVFLDGMPQKVRFRLSSEKSLDADYGDKLFSEVTFGYRSRASSYTVNSLLADRVTLTAYLPYGAKPEITDGGESLYGFIIDLRERFCLSANELMGEELGGTLAGMVTGNTSGMDAVSYADYRDSGLSHLFAVSGLHLSLITSAVLMVLRRFIKDYRFASAACIPFVLFFMAFAGFSFSVVRAGIMLVLVHTARALRREADTLNSLGIAALVLCVLNPYAAGDAGMLMSFSATAGLTVLYSPLSAWVRGVVRYDPKSRWAFVIRPVLRISVSSVIASVCTFPIAVLCFGQISLLSPIANVLCMYPAYGFLIFGTLGAAVYCLPLVGGVLGAVLFVPAWLCGRLTSIIAGIIAEIPGAGVAANYPFIAVMLVMWLALIALYFVLFAKDKSSRPGAALVCALCLQMLMLGAVVHNILNLSSQSVMIFGSDKGISVALVSGGQCAVIGAGGDEYDSVEVCNQLHDRNISQAIAVCLPENSERYALSADNIIGQLEPKSVFLQPSGSRYEPISQMCERFDAEMYSVIDARFSASGCGISFEEYTDAEGGVWIWAQCGVTMLMCPEQGNFMLLPEEYCMPDIAVVPDSDMINISCVDPLAVFVCAGSERSAHESAVLEYRGMKNVYAADDGCVIVTKNGQGICVDQQ